MMMIFIFWSVIISLLLRVIDCSNFFERSTMVVIKIVGYMCHMLFKRLYKKKGQITNF